MPGPIKKAVTKVKEKVAVNKAQKYHEKMVGGTKKANEEGAKDFMKKGGTVKKKKKG